MLLVNVLPGLILFLTDKSLESVVDAYSVDSADFWFPPDFWDAEHLAIVIGDHPCVCTSGSLLLVLAYIYLPLNLFCRVLFGVYAGSWLSPDNSASGILGHHHGLGGLLAG